MTHLPAGKYLYCVTAGDQRSLPPELPGIEGLPVSLLRYRELGAVASDVAPGAEVTLTRENGTRHVQVIERVMAEAPVLPCAFGIVAPSAYAVEREFLAAQADELRRELDRIRGQVEMGVTALWADLPAVFKEIGQHPELQRLKARAGPGGLLRQEAIDAGHFVQRRLAELRVAEETALLAALRPHAAELAMLSSLGDTTVTRAAFLLPRDRVEAFEHEVERQAGPRAPRIRVKLVGPAPPFNFVRLAISFARVPSHVPA